VSLSKLLCNCYVNETRHILTNFRVFGFFREGVQILGVEPLTV
jgi:hypothetical protein